MHRRSGGGGGAGAGGVAGGQGARGGAAGAGATPKKRVEVTDSESYLAKWSPAQGEKAKGVRLDFDEEKHCNRPGCESLLEKFVPPGAAPGGVTFAKCKDQTCAGGGSFLSFVTYCVACHQSIPAKTLCLSLHLGNKKYDNQHISNCLLEKVPGTETAKFALKAQEKDVGKSCVTCVQDDPTIKAGDILLATRAKKSDDVLHYSCARKKRKDYLRVVFAVQDKRHADWREKDAGSTAEKKAKLEEEQASVGFAVLAPDSDDDL